MRLIAGSVARSFFAGSSREMVGVATGVALSFEHLLRFSTIDSARREDD